jgi:hypothetical protein
LRNIAGRIRGDKDFVSIGKYEGSGTNDIHVAQFRQLLSSAGIDEVKITRSAQKRKDRISRWTLGLFDSILADEFIIVGRKIPPPVKRRDEKALRTSKFIL